MGDPTRNDGLEWGDIEPGEQSLKGAVGRRRTRVPKPMHQFDGLTASPLGDGGIAATTAKHREASVGKYGDQRVTLTGAARGSGTSAKKANRRPDSGCAIGSSPKAKAAACRKLANRSTLLDPAA